MGDCMLMRKRVITAAPTKLYLYNEGDECSAVSGGWSSLGPYGNATGFSFTKQASYLEIKGETSYSNGFNHVMKSGSQVDLTNFSVIKAEISNPAVAADEHDMSLHRTSFATSQLYFSGESSKLAKVVSTGGADRKIISIDISALTGLSYVYMLHQITAFGIASQSFKLHKMWLE